MESSGENLLEKPTKTPMVEYLNKTPSSDEATLVNDEENYLSPEQLKEIANCENLESLISIDLCLDSNKINFGNFGSYIPNLRYLKLSNSIIPRIHVLGGALCNVEVLWMQRCCLKSLDGLQEMKSLRELYFAFNEISDISVCGVLEYLEILDLEGNRVSNKKNILVLQTCQRLTNLTLENNPITKQFQSYSKYWNYVKIQLPNLTSLDNISSNSSVFPQAEYPNEYNFEENWNYINEVINETNLKSIVGDTQTLQNNVFDISKIPGLQFIETNNRIFTKSSSSNFPSKKFFDDSVTTRNSTSSGSASSNSNPGNSALTSGGIICGDIGKALRKRRSSIGSARMPGTNSIPVPNPSVTEKPYTVIPKPTRETTPSVSFLERFSSNLPTDTPVEDPHPTSSANDCGKMALSNNIMKAEFSSVDALQNSCTEVLEELQAWRRDFLRSSKKKNLVRGMLNADLKSNLSQRSFTDTTLPNQLQPTLQKQTTLACPSSKSKSITNDTNLTPDMAARTELVAGHSSTKVPKEMPSQSFLEPMSSGLILEDFNSDDLPVDVENPNLPNDLLKFKLRFRAQQAVSARQSELFLLSTDTSERRGSHDMRSLQKSLIRLINTQAASKAIESMDEHTIESSTYGNNQTNPKTAKNLLTKNIKASTPDSKLGQGASMISTIAPILPSTMTRSKIRFHNQQPLPSKPCIKQTNW